MNELLWDIAEKLRLADFFDEHGIPPVIIPIAVIAIVALIVLFLLPSQTQGPGEQGPCGDGSCDTSSGEDLMSCPEDCAIIPEGQKSLTVRLQGGVESSVEVRVDDQGYATVGKKTGKSNVFEFPGLSAQSVIVTVRNPANGQTLPSGLVQLDKQNNEITLDLPSSFFSTAGIPPPWGNFRVTIRDESGSPIKATVTPVLIKGSSRVLLDPHVVDGLGYFDLEANQMYGLIAEADGYESYDGRGNPSMLPAGGEATADITLRGARPGGVAALRVCSNAPGSIELLSLTGEELAEQPLVGGCTSFEITAEGVIASLLTSGNCAPVSKEIALRPGENSLNLETLCGQVARVRLKVLDENGSAVTSNASITAWYAEGSQIGGLLTTTADNFTEYVPVIPSTPMQFTMMLDGYPAQNTPEYILSPNENRSVSYTLDGSVLPEYEFLFNGLSYPDAVKTGSNFTASVSKVQYGSTDVSEHAEVAAFYAGRPCAVSKAKAWAANCLAPEQTGEYELAFVADYDGAVGSKTAKVRALATSIGYFALTPHAFVDTEPPMTLQFDIAFNGTPLDSLTNSSVGIYYGDTFVGATELSGSRGIYSFDANSPFPGEHTARLRLVKVAGAIYEQDFTVAFRSEPRSLMLTAQTQLSPRIVAPRAASTAYVALKRGTAEVPNLTNVYATLAVQRGAMPWDPAQHAYLLQLTAPAYEGIYPVSFELAYQALPQKKLYVIDTSKVKSDSCPISNCQNIPEVRRCVYKHKFEGFYSEQETVECIEDGWFGTDITHCLLSTPSKGDWKRDCGLSSEDTTLMSSFLLAFTDQMERNTYGSCGDMDNDGDVDDSDKTCLANIAAMKWLGDAGEADSPVPAACPSMLRGGFCYDIGTSSSLKGDFDGNEVINSDDASKMSLIVRDVSMGVTPPQQLLDFADFNQDGTVDGADMSCLQSFKNISIQDMIARSQQGLPNMPGFDPACLNVYDIGCRGADGDLNADGALNDVDLMLMGLIVSDVGGIFSGPSNTEVTWEGPFDVGNGQTLALPTPLPFSSDWMVELNGSFNFDIGQTDDRCAFFCDPSVDVWDEGGRLSAEPYTRGKLPGQTLDVSPSLWFSLDRTSYDLMAGYKGVASQWGGMTLRTSPAGQDTLRIEYYKDEQRVRIYWDGRLVGHFAYEAKSDGTFSVNINSLKFEGVTGAFKYYIGDLDVYASRYGSLECADFNNDGVIDETDFLCMSAVLEQGSSAMSSEFCKSCTRRGLEQGWYFVGEICMDGYDNDCDTTIDIARAGSRVDANRCDWCPNGQQGEKGGTWCWRGPFWDLDRGASPGVADGNYGVCMSHSWADEDVYDDPAEPFTRHLEHSTQQHEPECTVEMQCHFTMCFDNYRICSSSGAWRQFGSGAFDPLNSQISSEVGANRDQWVQDYAPASTTDSTTGSEQTFQQAWSLQTDANGNVVDRRNGNYVDLNNGNLINPTTGNYIDANSGEPINPETGYIIDQTTGQDTATVGTPQTTPDDFSTYRISMDGTHFIGSVCSTYVLNNQYYDTYYGPWGDFLWCEGSAPTRFRTDAAVTAPHCGDEWNDNCLAVADPCACVDDNMTSCGALGGTICACSTASGNTCPGRSTCPTGYTGVESSDCNPCCIPNGLCETSQPA